MELWNVLGSVCRVDIPVLMTEDYNVIAVGREKKDSKFLDSQKARDFKYFIMEAGLGNLGFIGAKFTWCNEQHGLMRIWERLDRTTYTSSWLELFQSRIVHHLAHVTLDHPLLLNIEEGATQGRNEIRVYR